MTGCSCAVVAVAVAVLAGVLFVGALQQQRSDVNLVCFNVIVKLSEERPLHRSNCEWDRLQRPQRWRPCWHLLRQFTFNTTVGCVAASFAFIFLAASSSFAFQNLSNRSASSKECIFPIKAIDDRNQHLDDRNYMNSTFLSFHEFFNVAKQLPISLPVPWLLLLSPNVAPPSVPCQVGVIAKVGMKLSVSITEARRMAWSSCWCCVSFSCRLCREASWNTPSLCAVCPSLCVSVCLFEIHFLKPNSHQSTHSDGRTSCAVPMQHNHQRKFSFSLGLGFPKWFLSIRLHIEFVHWIMAGKCQAVLY